MIERPILFSGPMVRAILDGQKTQTRRVIKSPAKNMQKDGCQVIRRNPDNDPWYKDYIWSMRTSTGVWGDYTNEKFLKFCPYGVPCDRLWVRETFYAWGKWEPYLDGKKDRWRFLDHTDEKHPIKYPATEGNRFYQGPANGGDDYHCRPSIFMKRKYSRIALEVTGVIVERVQDISDCDSLAEGIKPLDVAARGYIDARVAFRVLWDSINAKRGYSWDTNPWVWVVEFRMI
jgi:hypothetical protein